jgi:hypothetical protein
MFSGKEEWLSDLFYFCGSLNNNLFRFVIKLINRTQYGDKI